MSRIKNRNKYKVADYLTHRRITDSSPKLSRIAKDLLEYSEWVFEEKYLTEQMERLWELDLYHYYCHTLNADPVTMLKPTLIELHRFYYGFKGERLSYYMQELGDVL